MTHQTTLRIDHALNFAADGNVPEWIMLVPAGSKIEGRDGRWFANTNPDGVVAEFNRQGVDLVIDFEHGSEDGLSTPSPAAGWISEFENRLGAIWGRVKWTSDAAEMIRKREYRYISPAMWHHRKTREVVALTSVALTHQPNLRIQSLNRKANRSDRTPENSNPKEIKMDAQTRIALCSKLGLASEASDAAIMTAISGLQDEHQKALNSAEQPSLDKFVPRADHDKLKGDLELAQNKLAEGEQIEIEAKVDAAIADGKIAPASKDYHLAACKTDPAAFDKFIEGAPTLAVTEGSGLDEKSPNANSSLDDADKAMCSALGLDEAEYAKHNGKAAA